MRTDLSDLRALFVNCTLKRSPEVSNTAALAANSVAIMRAQGVHVDDHGIWIDPNDPERWALANDGGIAITWEHDAHLYFKRAKSSELLFGDPTYHRELLAQRIGI